LLLLVVALVLIAAVSAGWSFHGLSLVQLALPDSVAAPASVSTAQPASAPAESALYVWVAQAEPALESLLAIRYNIDVAADKADATGTWQVCRSAETTVARMRRQLPSPEPALNIALQQALNDYRSGLRDCVTGIVQQNVEDIELAAVYLHQANTELHVAIEMIERDLADSRSEDGMTI
jgi:hypothetical protein